MLLTGTQLNLITLDFLNIEYIFLNIAFNTFCTDIVC